VRRSKSEFYFFLRTKKHKIMSTEEKKRTEERIREREKRMVRELLENWFDDELFQKIREWIDENKWVDDELLRKKTEWRLRDLWKRDVKFYEERGFWLGREHQLLEELVEWLSRKEKEWYKIRDQQPKEKRELICSLDKKILPIEHRMFMLRLGIEDEVENNEYERLNSLLQILKRKRYALEDIESAREYKQMINWLAKEWNWYLETKELMLRKTRSKDITGVIMSFC